MLRWLAADALAPLLGVIGTAYLTLPDNLLGPVLAAQFGFLPGFLWLVIGAVLATLIAIHFGFTIVVAAALALAACGEKKAIDFTQKEKLMEIKVGTIIVATGFQTFDVKRVPQYGYGTFPNVYTALEMERTYIESVGGHRPSLMFNHRPALWMNPRQEFEEARREVDRYLFALTATLLAHYALNFALPVVFGHHDLLPTNFMDDGQRLWLIEAARYNVLPIDDDPRAIEGGDGVA